MTLADILTIEEVAQYLRVSERTVYEWAQKGQIPAGKLGASWRFQRSEIERWADEKLSQGKKQALPHIAPLREVLTPERVIILSAERKKEALEELFRSLMQATEVTDKDELLRAIFQREELMSTGIGLGIAVPHVRLDSIKGLIMALGISRDGIDDYESLDGKPVHIVCMIGAGRFQHTEYLKLLAVISARMKEESFRKSLLTAPDPETIYSILTDKGN